MTEAPPEVTWWNPFSWRRGQEYSDARDRDTQAYYDTYRPELSAEVAANLSRDTAVVDVDAAITGEFDAESLTENLKESASAAGKSVGNVAGSVVQGAGNFLGNVLLGFPAWFWLVVLVGGFFYLGGGTLLRGWIAKKAS